MNITFIRVLKKFIPPIVVDGVRFLKNKVVQKSLPWEYMPQGWQTVLKDPKIKGWNVPGVIEAYKSKWSWFVKEVNSTAPFDFTPESIKQAHCGNINAHNTIMSYAYALSVAAHNKSSISMLDWGGGFGHYYLISQALMPEVKIDYHCKDVPLIVEEGRKLLSGIHFYNDETCLLRRYDFVLASNSLQYSQDWASMLRRLAEATTSYIFITCVPVIHRSPTYVAVQRPYEYKYDTEYIGWCFNRSDFLKIAESVGLKLVREFFLGGQLLIFGAPEHPENRGFLFHKVTQGSGL